MRQNPDTNIFACFVSYPSFAASVSEQTKDEVIRKGDMFRSYIWGEAGLIVKQVPNGIMQLIDGVYETDR